MRRLALHVRGRRRVDHLDAVRNADGQVGREQGHVGTPAFRLGGQRDAHPARGAVAEKTDRIERLARAAGADEDLGAGERTLCLIDTCSEQRLDPRGDRLRLAHPPQSDLTFGELAGFGSDQLDAASPQRRHVRLRCLVLPHARVHRRRDQHGPPVCQRRLGEDVVGEAVGELGERVRGQGRDHEQIRALQMWIRVGALRPTGQREEGLSADEALGAAGRQRQHVVAGLDEQAHELAGLVGRDAAGDAEQDACHAHIVPTKGRPPKQRGRFGTD